MKLILGIAILVSIVLAGCLAPGGCGLPGQNQTYSPAQLKYLLLDHYNESRFFFCDPDYYPVGHGDELEKAIAIFPVIRNSTEEFDAIVEQKGLQPPYSDESKLIIYREYKKLNAIPLSPGAKDSYTLVVTGADSIMYGGGCTYDILPAGDTGSYWANRILLKSTLL